MKTLTMATAALLAGSLFALPASAEQLTACVKGDGGGKGKGSMRLVTDASSCKRSEFAVSWNVEGPEGPAGPEGEVGPAGPSGGGGSMTLVDSQGRVIANVSDVFPNSARLLARIDGQIVLLSVYSFAGSHTLSGTRGETAFFESSDCTGTAYFQHYGGNNGNPFAVDSVVSPPGRSLYLVNWLGAGLTRTISSQLYWDGNVQDWACFDFGTGYTWSNMRELVDPVADLSQFSPPFEVQGVEDLPLFGQ